MNNILKKILLIEVLIAVFAISACALVPVSTSATNPSVTGSQDFENCRQFFPYNTPLVLPHQAELQPRALCFSGFAILYSGKSRTPIYVAERLNRRALLASESIPRSNKFFEEARLPQGERSRLDDYRNSEYDRGHMAPAGDMGTQESKDQSFSLANIFPQNPENNRNAWRKIESDTRKYVMRAEGDVFVITGPVFDATHSTIGTNQVWVPQHMFKLVYDPTSSKAWAHWQDNTEDAKVNKPISYGELVRRTNVKYLAGSKDSNIE